MQDDEQLDLLAIFHYVVGGILALSAFFPGIYLAVGLFMLLAPEKMADGGSAPPVFVSWVFIAIGATLILLGWVVAGFIIAAGRALARRRHYQFCLVMAGIECLFTPFGTVLGVFTLITLIRPSVKQRFLPPAEAA